MVRQVTILASTVKARQTAEVSKTVAVTTAQTVQNVPGSTCWEYWLWCLDASAPVQGGDTALAGAMFGLSSSWMALSAMQPKTKREGEACRRSGVG